ncbi:transcriptional repressor [bacterium]|nr:transcriptional repressor [bacterium]
MDVRITEIDERLEQFKQACRRAGVKLTHQRLEIYREVAQTTDHPDAITVYKGVRKRLPTVSLDTVYRTLSFLVDLGVLSTLGSGRERARFDGNTERHHHFICTRCGKTRDFVSSAYDDVRPPRSARAYGEVESTHVELRGICHECAARDTDS